MTSIKKVISGLLVLTCVMSMNLLTIMANDETPTLNNTVTTVFGNSSFTWSHESHGTSANAADGTYTMFEGGGATITATKTFSVDQDREFLLEIYAASSITHEALSDMKFKIDSGSEVTLTNENSEVSGLSNPCLSGDVWITKSIKYNTKITLTAGTHTLTITVPEESNNRTEAYFAFDCVRFVPVVEEANVNKQDTTVYGNSSFTWNHTDIKESPNAADGTYTKMEGGGATITATKEFYVEDTGEYSFELYAASSITHEALSDIQFSIDDGNIVTLTGENSAVRALDNPCISGELWTTKSIRYNTNITLSAGTHTLKIIVPQESNNRTEAYFVFDCARFIPPEPKQIITDIENVLEFEKFYPSYALTSNGASGGIVVNILQYNATEHNIQMVFDVEKAGNYKFVMDASVEQGVSSPQFHLSPVFISVNGGSEFEISNSKQDTFSVTSGALYECDWESSRITLTESIALTEGENTIAIRVPARQAGDMVVGTFDCIRLVRIKNIESITAGFGNGLIKRGESIPVSMQNQDGNAVTSGDFSQITYTSSNPDVAEVENGVLKAKNYGQTKITINAVANGQNLEAECDVNVVSENGIWLSSLEKTAAGIKVIISAIEDYSGGDSLLVGVYEQKEGMVTSLKSMVTQVTPAISGNSETDVEVSLSEYEDGDVVRVFLLDNSNLKRALYTKLTYGGVIE